mgnify:CR=1 FL=1
MRNILLLFLRYGGFFTFIVLEAISFVLIVRFNQEQRAIFLSSANRWTGKTLYQYDRLLGYLDAPDLADSLAMENAHLRGDIEVYKQLLTGRPPDTLGRDSLDQHFTFIAAKVISNSVNRNNNTLTLDRGLSSGVSERSGVITDKGVVGIVTKASNCCSVVMSILHQDSRISATIKRVGYFGFLTWSGGDPGKAQLVDIPKHVEVKVGDTLVTSGYSTFFPPDIPVGTVARFWTESGSNYQNIEVTLQQDLSKLEYVLVVKNPWRDQLDQLEQSAKQ